VSAVSMPFGEGDQMEFIKPNLQLAGFFLVFSLVIIGLLAMLSWWH
jgi:hypothetical protein